MSCYWDVDVLKGWVIVMKTMMIVRSDDDGGSGNFIDLSDIVEPR